MVVRLARVRTPPDTNTDARACANRSPPPRQGTPWPLRSFPVEMRKPRGLPFPWPKVIWPVLFAFVLAWGLGRWGPQEKAPLEGASGGLMDPHPPPSASHPERSRLEEIGEGEGVSPESGGLGTAEAVPPTEEEIAFGPPTPRPEDLPGAGDLETHRVRDGESLSLIAALYEVSIAALMETNTLKDDRIQVGQILLIPPWAPPPADAPLPDGWFKVRPGDSFWKIAEERGVGVQEIIDLNPDLDPAKIRPGDLIRVPLP